MRSKSNRSMNSSRRLLRALLVTGLISLLVITANVLTAQGLENKLLPGAILDLLDSDEISAQEQAVNRRIREYPLKAPTIPHSVEGFRINKNLNQCLVCHAPDVAPLMKAPTVAASHFADRDGNYLANVAPRRYFCYQCHVPQTISQPLVGSSKE